jgi:hypothetical protein
VSDSHSGGCQCGNIRYRIDGKGLALFICHCKDCQIQSGSAFGMSLIVMEDEFHLVQGNLKTFEVSVDSGRRKTCAFCPDCGVRIYNTTGDRMSIKAGTLDDSTWLKPDAHYWIKSKQPWTQLPEDLPCYADHQ